MLCRKVVPKGFRLTGQKTILTLEQREEILRRLATGETQTAVAKDFNVTRAGIHADGLLKDEEIYNIFDTKMLLKRKTGVAVSQNSGLAGVAHWMNSFFGLEGVKALDKRDPIVEKIKNWVDEQYNDGRSTSLSDEELEHAIRQLTPEVFDLVL